MHKRSIFLLQFLQKTTTNFDISPLEKVEVYLHEITGYTEFPLAYSLLNRNYLPVFQLILEARPVKPEADSLAVQ